MASTGSDRGSPGRTRPAFAGPVMNRGSNKISPPPNARAGSLLNSSVLIPTLAPMKRLCLLFVTFPLSIPSLTAAQDAATEEKLNQLNGKIEDIIAAQDSQRKRLAELAKEIDHLREQMGK